MNDLVLQFFKPKTVYGAVTNEEKFPYFSVFIVFLLLVINVILGAPVTERVAIVTLSKMDMPDNLIDQSMDMIHKMHFLTSFISVIAKVIYLLFFAFVLYLILRVFQVKASFKHVVILFSYVYVFTILGEIANYLIAYHQGINNITDALEVSYTGLNHFLSHEHVGNMVYALSTLINPFVLLLLFYLTMAISSGFKQSYLKASIITFLFVLIEQVIPVYLSVRAMK
jgi:hypothetical protein